MNNVEKPYDLEDRLILFSISILNVSESIYKNFAGNHLTDQIIRSGTSPALHYGEARSAESRKDFIHKLKILLKELRETYTALQIIILKPLTSNKTLTENTLTECNELISIFVKSIQTAKANLEAEMTKSAKKI